QKRVIDQNCRSPSSTENSKIRCGMTAIPILLSHLYRSHSLLFLGCSLSVDRTMKTFEVVLQDELLRPKVADHYAIVEQPDDNQKFNALDMQLQRCNIKPIWYEFGHHEKVLDILVNTINQLKYGY
ncbi:SIR2 family protein, partial [Aeromonas allosaccharophila]